MILPQATVTLTVHGMTCNSCVHSIQSQLSSTLGVVEGTVNLKEEKATILYHPSLIEVWQIVTVIEDSTAAKKSQPPNESSKTVQLTVRGMTCASCVSSIDHALKSTPGILTCSIFLLAERAEVTYDPSLIPTDQHVADIINDAGFEATAATSLQTSRLQIFGMHCASCVNKIERDIPAHLPGIISMRVDLLRQSGVVEFDTKLVGLRLIVARIEEIGFNALIESLKRTREIQLWRKQFWTAMTFGFPVFLISMHQLFPGLSWGVLLMGLLTVPVQFGVGKMFYESALKSAKHGTYTMDVLVVLGTSVAFFFSVLQTLRSIMFAMNPAPEVFFETSATLITFVTLGRYLENVAKGKTSDAISKLMSLSPAQATILVDGENPYAVSVAAVTSPTTLKALVEKKIPAELLQVGDLVKIIPGDRFVDGGVCACYEACGDTVITGTLNQTGVLHVRATRVGGDTTLSQILKLVNESQSSKAPIQDIADQVAGYFVPGVVTLSLVTFFFLVFESWWRWTALCGVEVGISVVIVACPCALGLATPTAIMVGDFDKGGRPLSVARKVTTVVFDKTGTLTEGRMEVCGSLEGEGWGALGRRNSEHAIGKALFGYAEEGAGKVVGEMEVIEFEAVPGFGVICTVLYCDHSYRVKVGNQKYLEMDRTWGDGRTVVFASVEKKGGVGMFLGGFAVSDSIRESALPTLNALRRMGMRVVMVTGDHMFIGFRNVGSVLMMVGDGVNDCAVIAQSDLGVAVGGATDGVVESADIVCMRRELGGNLLMIPLAMGVGLPWGYYLHPMLAGMAMSLSSVSVVCSSLMLKLYQPPRLDGEGGRLGGVWEWVEGWRRRVFYKAVASSEMEMDEA
ncbi:hypothetical protein BC829DRAFT_428170 [Chytridium lagenaria]|nr:hypothetical protein BC829DRAFT_428170 [Chytridium lagenaria]